VNQVRCPLRLRGMLLPLSPTRRAQLLFALGLALVLAGVGLHVFEFAASRDMSPPWSMRGMQVSGLMVGGMAVMPIGILICAFSMAAAPGAVETAASASLSPDAVVRALARLPRGEAFAAVDSAAFSRQHWLLCFVLLLTVVVDAMKPATLGFVVPGIRKEYGLSSLEAAQFPTAALSGTAVGSVVWGIVADRYGRRPAIVVAALIFVATSVCAAMPSFTWNLAMCIFMGLSAGGMLPIVYTLLSEMTPTAFRGPVMIIVGGVGGAGGYGAVAGLSAWLQPLSSWRVLWLLNIPTGMLVLAMMREIPESPRFLLANGRFVECAALLRAFRRDADTPALVASIDARVAVAAVEMATAEKEGEASALDAADGMHVDAGEGAAFTPAGSAEPSPLLAKRPSFLELSRALLASGLAGPTLAMSVYNFAWGICNNGFLLWMPSVMRAAGAVDVDGVLAYSALISVLSVPLVALLFMRTTRGSLLLCPLLLLAALVSFIVTGSDMAHQSGNLFASLIVLLASATATNAVVSAYSAEVYSTQYRGLGTGVIAGAGKLAGIFASSLVAAVAARGDPVREPAVLTLAIMTAGVIGVALSCPETRKLSLLEIHELLRAGGAVAAAAEDPARLDGHRQPGGHAAAGHGGRLAP
jgi:putative MFS transporter